MRAAAGGEPSDPAASARETCLRLLATRDRTRWELAQALQRRETPDEVSGVVLDRLAELGLIDDTAFAEAFVRSAQQHRGLGRQALRAELDRRGVAGDVSAAAVRAVDADTEEATARGLVQRRLRTMGDLEPRTAMRRLLGMLARKGYPQALARRVVLDEVGPDRSGAVGDEAVDGG